MPNKRYILTTIAKVLKLGFEDNQLYQFDVDTASISSDGKITITLAGVPASNARENIEKIMECKL